MAIPFAFECFADQDVFLVLRDKAMVPLTKVHAFSQGDVINNLVRGTARIGLVDEDPGKTHHRRRDQMVVVSSTIDLEVRRIEDRHLILLKPDLEGCFERSLRLAGLKPALDSLHRALAIPEAQHRNHVRFREQLAQLRASTDSFIAALERSCASSSGRDRRPPTAAASPIRRRRTPSRPSSPSLVACARRTSSDGHS